MEGHDFDVLRYLDSEEAITEYLAAIAEENNPHLMQTALRDVEKARTLKRIAKRREPLGEGR